MILFIWKPIYFLNIGSTLLGSGILKGLYLKHDSIIPFYCSIIFRMQLQLNLFQAHKIKVNIWLLFTILLLLESSDENDCPSFKNMSMLPFLQNQDIKWKASSHWLWLACSLSLKHSCVAGLVLRYGTLVLLVSQTLLDKSTQPVVFPYCNKNNNTLLILLLLLFF